MKPINLKIKGLNSFIEEQEIDFEKLTERGLFGIFGDTGSGKSTILDGITLALYGSIARSTTKYINSNCTSAKVSFQFQISGKQTRVYIVDRQYRKDKATGNARVSNAKIVEIIGENVEVLAEGSTSVTKKCEEIIGLKIEDFTRTVVLPQGKFSEFLKLEGKPRREMLERLFNLQKYGDDLSHKLAKEIRKNRNEENILIGELKAYENISEKALEENNEILKSIDKKLKEGKEKQNKIEKKFLEGQEIWKLQNELEEYKQSKNELKSEEENINIKKEKVRLGESALKVTPYINAYEEVINKIKSSETELENLNKELEIINKDKLIVEKKLNELRIKKEEELPKYKIKQEKVSDAIKEKEALEIIVKEIEELEKMNTKLNNVLEEKKNQWDELKKNIEELNTTIIKKEQDSELLKVDVEYKTKVSQGLLINNEYGNLIKQKEEIKSNLLNTEKDIKSNEEKCALLKNDIEENETTLKKLNEQLNEVKNNCPGSQDDLLELREKHINGKDKWNKYNKLNKEIDQINAVLKKATVEIKDQKEEKNKLENKINELKEEQKRIETESLAQRLREELAHGEACPVCGSKEHHLQNIEIKDSSKLNSLKKELSKDEKALKLLDENITINETNIKNEESKLKDKSSEINELGNAFKECAISELEEKFSAFSEKLKEYNEKKTSTEDKIRKVTEKKNKFDIDFSSANTSLEENKKQYNNLMENQVNLVEEIKKVETELELIKKELKIEDFEEKNKEILSKEKKKNKLEKEIKKCRTELKEFSDQNENLAKDISQLKEEIAEQAASITEKSKNKDEKIISIKNKVGDENDLIGLSKKIAESIKEIEVSFKATEKKKNDIDERYEKLNSDIKVIKGKLESLTERKVTNCKELEMNLKKENFKDIEEAKKYLLDEKTIESYKNQIEKYSNDLSKLQGAIENIIKKLNERSILKEEWEELQKKKEANDKEVKELDEERIKQVAHVTNIKARLSKFLELSKKKDKLDHKLALLNDLEKLFKGKRFVEYIAANQLKYVSIEASKILREITSGNYALEVDENARFIIRDYKNGGAGREASTLSGGETFLSSLALALALSSQIQLKGTAPLELFFLDEGFGTLDNNLLEIVMESLERIHNDKLKIGIISHVDSIKSRVPVKLLLTPAESGKGGSKVKLEIS